MSPQKGGGGAFISREDFKELNSKKEVPSMDLFHDYELAILKLHP